jgi:hypothetical protein
MESLIDSCRDALGGEDVLYRYPGGDEFTVNGIFERERRAEFDSPGTLPILFVKLSDFADLEAFRDTSSPQAGDEITVGAVLYTVIDPQNDGQGGCKLFLQKKGDL